MSTNRNDTGFAEISGSQATDSISWSELIAIHRDRLHISQAELARLVGVSRNYISLIERGHIENVSLKVITGIFNKLGMALRVVYVG